jgi:hypothetical protein
VGGVEGHVRDATGRPLATASVYLQGTDSALVDLVATDRLGRFRFPAVPAGEWILTAELIGYARAQSDVFVVAGASVFETRLEMP